MEDSLPFQKSDAKKF